MSPEERYKKILEKFLPPGFVEDAFVLLKNDEVHLKITKTRNTKLGDYRSPFGSKGHRISINGELSPQEFLITFLHEFAHLNVNKSFGNRVKPHGKEWKSEFKSLLAKTLERDLFIPEVEILIKKIVKSKSSFPINIIDDIRRSLATNSGKGKILVGDLMPETVFTLKSGRTFKLGEKRRKRFSCTEINTGRVFSVHPLAEVVSFEEI